MKTKAQQIMDEHRPHTAEEITEAIKAIAAEFEPYIIRQRRHFHKHPEPSLEEFRTTSDIAGQLDAMNIPYEQPLATGLVATLRGTAPDAYRKDGTPRRRLLMRADIDALPVTERTKDEFASVNEGVMHACGHDAHIAMMLGCLQILRHMTDEIHGEIRVVFQPSEENGTGARMMCETGVCEGVDGAFAMHIWSEVDAGTISCEPGPRMANTDWFRVDVHGTSCHGAMPQRGSDAVMVAAEIVNALQTIVSREVSPYEPAVVTVGELHAGTARNVIAGEAYLAGTVRTYSTATHELMPALINRIAVHTAQALGAEAELTDYTMAHLAVINDEAASERCRTAVHKCLGAEGEGRYRGTLSGEDYSEYLQHVPGVLAFVGCRNPQIGATYAMHSCYFKIDESVLAKGSMVAAQYAIDFLSEPTQTELDGPLVTRVAEKNPQLADKIRGARSATVDAHHALQDARRARMSAAHDLREAHARAHDDAERTAPRVERDSAGEKGPAGDTPTEGVE